MIDTRGDDNDSTAQGREDDSKAVLPTEIAPTNNTENVDLSALTNNSNNNQAHIPSEAEQTAPSIETDSQDNRTPSNSDQTEAPSHNELTQSQQTNEGDENAKSRETPTTNQSEQVDVPSQGEQTTPSAETNPQDNRTPSNSDQTEAPSHNELTQSQQTNEGDENAKSQETPTPNQSEQVLDVQPEGEQTTPSAETNPQDKNTPSNSDQTEAPSHNELTQSQQTNEGDENAKSQETPTTNQPEQVVDVASHGEKKGPSTETDPEDNNTPSDSDGTTASSHNEADKSQQTSDNNENAYRQENLTSDEPEQVVAAPTQGNETAASAQTNSQDNNTTSNSYDTKAQTEALRTEQTNDSDENGNSQEKPSTNRTEQVLDMPSEREKTAPSTETDPQDNNTPSDSDDTKPQKEVTQSQQTSDSDESASRQENLTSDKPERVVAAQKQGNETAASAETNPQDNNTPSNPDDTKAQNEGIQSQQTSDSDENAYRQENLTSDEPQQVVAASRQANEAAASAETNPQDNNTPSNSDVTEAPSENEVIESEKTSSGDENGNAQEKPTTNQLEQVVDVPSEGEQTTLSTETDPQDNKTPSNSDQTEAPSHNELTQSQQTNEGDENAKSQETPTTNQSEQRVHVQREGEKTAPSAETDPQDKNTASDSDATTAPSHNEVTQSQLISDSDENANSQESPTTNQLKQELDVSNQGNQTAPSGETNPEDNNTPSNSDDTKAQNEGIQSQQTSDNNENANSQENLTYSQAKEVANVILEGSCSSKPNDLISTDVTETGASVSAGEMNPIVSLQSEARVLSVRSIPATNNAAETESIPSVTTGGETSRTIQKVDEIKVQTQFQERIENDRLIDYKSSSYKIDQSKPWLNLQFHNQERTKVIKPDEIQIPDPPQWEVDENVLNRIKGSIIGMALGDALGAHVEFRPHSYLEKNPINDLQGGGTWGLKKGQFTDDTSMALCLADSLIACRGFVPYDQLVRYKWWYEYGYMSSTGDCFDIGNATRDSVLTFKDRQRDVVNQSGTAGDNIDHISDEKLNEFNVYCSENGVAGNGALMRLGPVPLFFFKSPKTAVEYSGISGQITHGDKKAYDACRYYGALIVAALHGFNKDQLLDENFYSKFKSLFGDKDLHEDIKEIAQGSYKRKNGYDGGIRGKGYIVDALEAALWAFYSTESFAEGALAAVNLGDDTDTTAAIYGQLAGAFYGYKQLPSKWTVQVYARTFLEKLSEWIAYEGHSWYDRCSQSSVE